MRFDKQNRDTLETGMYGPTGSCVVWEVSDDPVAYLDAVNCMETRARDIREGKAGELVWLVEHPPLYTAGTSAKVSDLLNHERFDVFEAGRGGEYTYHGPGQRIAYVMLDLSTRKQDLRRFVSNLEQWVINVLDQFNVKGERREDRVGVWVMRPDKPPLADGTPREDKIAAIGIRVRKWVTFHGISLNVEPELEHYSGIIPCGVEGHGITSLVDLGLPVTMDDVDQVLRSEFEKLFGPVA